MENPGYCPDAKEIAVIDSKGEEKVQIVLYRRRWVILMIFSLISMMNEIIWISLSSVSTIVKEYYKVSFSSVNWLAMIFSALYFTVVVAVFVLNKFGLRFTIIMGALCNALASALRLIGYTRSGYPLVLAGNIVGGIAQSFLMFIPPTLSSVWFGDEERGRASAIGMLMNMLGVALGFLMTSQLIPHSDDYDHAVKHGMKITMVIQSVICATLLVASFLFIRDKPDSPPSFSQIMNNKRKAEKKEKKEKGGLEEERTESTGFFKNLKGMMTSPTFHCMVQAYGFYYGVFNSMSTLLNQMTTRYFPEHVAEIGIMGFSAVLCGLVSMLLAGFYIDKTHRYKRITLFIFAGAGITLFSFSLVLRYSHNFVLSFVLYCICGLFQYPFLAIGLEFIAELMYPVKESNLSFVCLFCGTAYGVIFVNVLGLIIHNVGAEVAGYVAASLYFIAFICVSLVKEDLKRYNVDQARNRMEDARSQS